jgi:GT2 family glycosyltransferase
VHPHVEIIETHANLGFAAGCNVGMRTAVQHRADYLWLLNNDTTAPPDTCSKLVAKALANPQAGIIGSVLYFMHDPTHVQAWAGGTIHPWIGFSTHQAAPAPIGPQTYFTFASALIPRPVVEHVGVLYEGFFMYWDDSDYALRVTRAGYTLAVAEDTAILHKEGASSGPRSPRVDRWSAASGLHFLRRHSPAPVLSMALFIAVRITSRAVRGRWKNLRAVLDGVRDYRAQRHIAHTDKL